MPIFEHDDKFSDNEFKRQQKQLNDKMQRLKKDTQENEFKRFTEGDFNLHLDEDDDDNGNATELAPA